MLPFKGRADKVESVSQSVSVAVSDIPIHSCRKLGAAAFQSWSEATSLLKTHLVWYTEMLGRFRHDIFSLGVSTNDRYFF